MDPILFHRSDTAHSKESKVPPVSGFSMFTANRLPMGNGDSPSQFGTATAEAGKSLFFRTVNSGPSTIGRADTLPCSPFFSIRIDPVSGHSRSKQEHPHDQNKRERESRQAYGGQKAGKACLAYNCHHARQHGESGTFPAGLEK